MKPITYVKTALAVMQLRMVKPVVYVKKNGLKMRNIMMNDNNVVWWTDEDSIDFIAIVQWLKKYDYVWSDDE